MLALGLSSAACAAPQATSEPASGSATTKGAPAPAEPVAVEVPEGFAVATFAGGCFWCMEPPYDELEGVHSTTSGYTGGDEVDPTYKQVASGLTGHTEAVQVVYDPAVVSYERLLEVYWVNVDPLTADRQFCDWGRQYRPAIFAHGEEQLRLARESKKAIEDSGRFDQPIVVEIHPAPAYYPAEDYHQDFYLKSPVRYKSYRLGCRRDARLKELWGDAAGG